MTSTPTGEIYFTDTDNGGGDEYQVAISGTVVDPQTRIAGFARLP